MRCRRRDSVEHPPSIPEALGTIPLTNQKTGIRCLQSVWVHLSVSIWFVCSTRKSPLLLLLQPYSQKQPPYEDTSTRGWAHAS